MTNGAEPAATAAAGTEGSAERPAVLVVDDDPRMREVAVWALEDEGFLVDEAADRTQANERAHERTPALVVLDMALPPDDGGVVANDLRAAHGA